MSYSFCVIGDYVLRITEYTDLHIIPKYNIILQKQLREDWDFKIWFSNKNKIGSVTDTEPWLFEPLFWLYTTP